MCPRVRQIPQVNAQTVTILQGERRKERDDRRDRTVTKNHDVPRVELSLSVRRKARGIDLSLKIGTGDERRRRERVHTERDG